MTETTGLVQRLTVIPSESMACVWIGPTPAINELLLVVPGASEAMSVDALRNTMISALVAAQVSRHEVVAVHADDVPRPVLWTQV
jgi:hypothetical protein